MPWNHSYTIANTFTTLADTITKIQSPRYNHQVHVQLLTCCSSLRLPAAWLQPVCPADKTAICQLGSGKFLERKGSQAACPNGKCDPLDCCAPTCKGFVCPDDGAIAWAPKPAAPETIACSGPTCEIREW